MKGWAMRENKEPRLPQNKKQDSWLLDIAKEMLEMADEYPAYRVVTHLLDHDAEEDIPEDVAKRSPLIDIGLDDLRVRFVTSGLRRNSRLSEDVEPLRLSNVGIRLRRIGQDFPDRGAAFVESLTENDTLWFVAPVAAITLRRNDETQLFCLLARSEPQPRLARLWFLLTSMKRIYQGWRSAGE
jgi:hypothetical protein